MSNTRTTNDDSVLHQNRFASSPEFERGLLGNLVAKRASMLDNKADRELIWFLQYLSHQEGGLAAVATELLSKYPQRIGTAAMLTIGKAATKNYSADEVRSVRSDLPRVFRRDFRLRGETRREFSRLLCMADRLAGESEISREAMALADYSMEEISRREEERAAKRTAEQVRDREEAAKYPATYPVSTFVGLCRNVAEGNAGSECADLPLEKELSALCLDPAWDLAAGGPWYFVGLVHVLRDYYRQWILTKGKDIVVTELGVRVCETLDYTLYSKSMTLIEGDARTGKTFSARSWCEQHPGQARFVEVPTGNDDKTFFRAIARGLGLGNFQQYKALEIRERVECVLLTGDILLCLDEGHRLWPEVNLTRGFPKRINWVMSMANQSVPICIISTPQFVERQLAARQFAGWNDAQFIGRLGHRERLPSELSLKDLIAVAKSVLPEGDDKTLRALAAYARTSARYLAAIDAIVKRARYVAGRAGHADVTTEDVRRAMSEAVIPSDTMLVRALENTKTPHRRILPAPAPVQSENQFPERGTLPISNSGSRLEFSRQPEGDASNILK
ncbi:MAG TPA: AAA family ATPase [Verrucomicrobiae bacterium]|nr:AAA family ATPase [Verrucomicrobiae bacterium]